MTNTDTDLNGQREQALDYWRRGIPSSLPKSNPFKGDAQAHRWGWHKDEAAYTDDCPICAAGK